MMGKPISIDFLGQTDAQLEWTHSCIEDGATSSRFSMLHSSKNSRMGEGWEPTDMYAINARFLTKPTAPPYKIFIERHDVKFLSLRAVRFGQTLQTKVRLIIAVCDAAFIFSWHNLMVKPV